MDKQSIEVAGGATGGILSMELVEMIEVFAPVAQSVIQITIGLLTIVFLIYKIKHVKNGKGN